MIKFNKLLHCSQQQEVIVYSIKSGRWLHEVKEMDGIEIITLTPENIGKYGVCGYKDVQKHVELQRKIEWMKKYQPLGLTIKVLVIEGGGTQGMIEYIPGKYAHRPVNAENYMFIHCLFVGFKKEFKEQGFATLLLSECISDAKEKGFKGVAVVTRKGSFMADNMIFIKNGFEIVDKALPDFELCALKFDETIANPAFLPIALQSSSSDKDMVIYRSAQCPYSVKNVNAIMESAYSMNIPVKLVEIDDAEKAQNVPCPFGTFCISYNGKIIAHHPISNTRFLNIMKSMKSS